MAKDTRSFFERLTGSVKIEDAEPEENTAVDINELSIDGPVPAKISTIPAKSFKQETGHALRKKPARYEIIEGDEETAPKTSFFAKTAAKMKERTWKDDGASEENVPMAEKRQYVNEEKHEEAPEVEGQLTVDIYDGGDEIVIQSTVAGVKPEDLDVSITNDMVTIKGRRRKQEEVREENYYYRELYWGAFSRSVILPEEIEVDKSEAALKNGLLTVKLPKKNKNVAQKIKVKME